GFVTKRLLSAGGSMFSRGGLTVRRSRMIDRVAARVVFNDCYAKRRLMPKLSGEQVHLIKQLRRDGCVILDGFLSGALLVRLRLDFESSLRTLKFEMPCLAQARIDPVRHAELIDNFMYGSPSQLKQHGAAFDRDEAEDYDQVLRDFNPS